MRVTRPIVELMMVATATLSAWVAAEAYARSRGTTAPVGERQDRVVLFPSPAPLSVHLTQEERLMVGAGQRAPIVGAVVILAAILRRRSAVRG